MSIFTISIIFVVLVLIPGLVSFRIASLRERNSTGFLTFAGGYLLGVTLVHLLPEVFEHNNSFNISLLILLGFFIQKGLELVSSGAEHGHLHQYNSGHKHDNKGVVMVIISLCIHAFMEGTIIGEDQHESYSLVLSIGLHKIPATLALVSILVCMPISKTLCYTMLGLFALSTPVGIFIGKSMISPENYVFVIALVSGGFLQISTTIFFESNEHHKFNITKFAWSVIGAALAVISSYFEF